MRSERKARISGLAGTEHARNRTLPDLTFPVTGYEISQGVHTPSFELLTEAAKNWSPIVAFKAYEFSYG